MTQYIPQILWFVCLMLVMNSIRRLTDKLLKVQARVRTLELERAINQRGFFLRDDLPIRSTKDGSTTFEGREQAYSLFSKQPYERHAVYGDPLAWAVEQAHKHVMEQA